MPIRQDVQDAFTTLGLDTDADFQTATKAYRRLALLHHPDRNKDDPDATQRFQEIGHAWDICQRYYENPSWGESRFGMDSDEMSVDEEELFDFYMFMFKEALFNRFEQSRKRYRHEHPGRHAAGIPIFTFSRSFSPAYSGSNVDDSQERQEKHEARQKANNEAYERRKRELELEIEREERESKEQAKKQKADEDRLVSAHERAFQAAYSGESNQLQSLIKEFNIDVTAPRNLRSAKNVRKQDDAQYETLLHAAATRCDEQTFTFLVEKGADPNVLNKHQHTPFHAAIKAGNSNLVRFILERPGKTFQAYHPSKATPSGCTPLQLAIESGDRPTVELLVKYATVHNVERCWKLGDMSEELRNVLRTKKGFVPPGEGLEKPAPSISKSTSKKTQKQQDLAQEKENRIAEELRRAEINRQRKEERAARRAVMEQERMAREEDERRRKERQEEEERQRAEEVRQREEAAARARELEEARLRAQAEAKLRAEQEARRKAEQEARDKTAAAEKARVEKERQKQEQARKAKEKQERERLEKEAKERERLERQRIDRERLEKEREERERREREQRKAEEQKALQQERARQAALERADREREADATRRMEEMVRAQPAVSPTAATAESSSRRKRTPLTEEQRKEIHREKQKERRKAKKVLLRQQERVVQASSSTSTPPTVISQPMTPPPQPSPAPVPSKSPKVARKADKDPVDVEQMDEQQRKRHENLMRRRAEQSARDKERHRRLIEERKAARATAQAPSQPLTKPSTETPEYVPLTPVSTHTTRAPFEAPAFMEDIQTCVGVEDLFRAERPPKPIEPQDQQPKPNARRPYRKSYRANRA